VPSDALTIRDPNEMAKSTLKHIDPNFIKIAKKHNIILAGENFGTGSYREEEVNVFKILGIKVIIAKSFARIYFRNLINLGIPGIVLAWDKNSFSYGDFLVISLKEGDIFNRTKNSRMAFQKLPIFLTKILKDGGILNQIKKKL
jgi:3-isopropylmalate/(R)-2-methylmalate dehydratase small subunit